MAFLLMDRDFEHTQMVAFMSKDEDEGKGPYEVIEGLMQPKVEPYKRQELMDVMPSIYSVSTVNTMAKRMLLEGVVTMVLTIFEWLIAWLMKHAIWWLNYQTIMCHFSDEEGVQMLFASADHE